MCQGSRPALIGQVEAIYSLTAPSHEWLSINLFKNYLELTRAQADRGEKVEFVDAFSEERREKFCGHNIAGTYWERVLCRIHTHTRLLQRAHTLTHTH